MNRSRKISSLLLAAVMLLTLAACGAKKDEPAAPEEPAAWSREGYFEDENGNILSVTWMEDADEPGWYVGCMLGDFMAGQILPQEGNGLHGELASWDGSGDPLTVTVSEEGEDGLLLAVEGGETYHFAPMEMPEATIFISINTEGWGNIDYAEGEEAPEIDPEYPYQSAQINLAEPTVHTFVAWPQAGNLFVKWTKDGADFSTEPQITVLLDESADYVAVFEEDPGWQNPVMNFVGEYQSGRAHAAVSADSGDGAFITIEWGSSAWELTRWSIYGRFDEETLSVSYSNCTKSNLVCDDSGEVKSDEVERDDCSGTITFNYDDLTFTWHDDQSESGEDMVFEWTPPTVD